MKIAILCSRHVRPTFEQIMQDNSLPDRFVFWVYNDFAEIDGLYRQGCKGVQGILCTGDVPYTYFQMIHPECTLPVRYVENSSLLHASLMLLRHQMEHPEIPLNQLFCDFLGDLHAHSVFARVIPANSMPYTLSVADLDENFFSQVAGDVIRLYQQGKIKKCFLSLNSLYHKLQEAGVPCERIPIQPENILAALYAILDDVDGAAQPGQLLAFLDYTHTDAIAGDAAEVEYRQITLMKALVDYKRQTLPERSYTINRDGELLELATPTPPEGDAVQPMLDCLAYLRQSYPYPVSVGIGVGADMHQCREAAFQALGYARGFGGGCAFSLHRRQLTGPLQNHRCLVLDTTLIASTTKMSRTLGIDNLNYLRLLSLFKKQGVVTAAQVADYLNIAGRSAHRILLLLIEQDMVRAVAPPEGAAPPQKGRPTKYFALANTTQVAQAGPVPG